MPDVPPVSAIADVLALCGERGWLTPPLVPMVAAAAPVVGRAVTVELAVGEHGTGLGPLQELLSGDLEGAVVVVAGASTLAGAVWGEILSRAAVGRGALGVLVDGSVRDRTAMAAEGLAVYARSLAVVGPAGRVSVVAVGSPVAIDGTPIAPDDRIVLDDAGAVVLAAERADAVLADATAYAEAEERVLADLAGGAPLRDAYRHKKSLIDARAWARPAGR